MVDLIRKQRPHGQHWVLVIALSRRGRWCVMSSCFPIVSLRWFTVGLPTWPGIYSGGLFLHYTAQHAAGHHQHLRFRWRAVWLRDLRYDPLLPALRFPQKGLIYVQPEGLPCQTPLWAPEIRWALNFICKLVVLVLKLSDVVSFNEYRDYFFHPSFTLGFGITTTFWDHPFNTVIPDEKF